MLLQVEVWQGQASWLKVFQLQRFKGKAFGLISLALGSKDKKFYIILDHSWSKKVLFRYFTSEGARISKAHDADVWHKKKISWNQNNLGCEGPVKVTWSNLLPQIMRSCIPLTVKNVFWKCIYRAFGVLVYDLDLNLWSCLLLIFKSFFFFPSFLCIFSSAFLMSV